MANILIIKLGALGDMIMATPLIRQIQQHHSDDVVFLLTAPEFAGLFISWPALSVNSFPRKGFAAFAQTVKWIRSCRFNSVYDLQSNDRSALLCALSGVPRRIGNHRHFPYHLHPEEKWNGQCHIFDRMLDVLRAGGVYAHYEPPSLPVNDEDIAVVDHWLQQNRLTDTPLVIMHAGGSPQHPQKRWPYFGELAARVELSGYKVIWVGTGIDGNTNQKLTESAGIDATGVFSLSSLVHLGKQARFAVTNDSGPMHVLSCCGIPVYGLFGPTNWRRNHGIGQKTHVLCPQRGAPGFVPVDLDNLGVSSVIERLLSDGLV